MRRYGNYSGSQDREESRFPIDIRSKSTDTDMSPLLSKTVNLLEASALALADIKTNLSQSYDITTTIPPIAEPQKERMRELLTSTCILQRDLLKMLS